MSNKKLEIVLDFLINLKSDKAQVERLAKETETILGIIKPEIDFNSAEIKSSMV